MSNRPAQPFILVALVTILLLAMHFLPQITVWDRHLRAVNILSDVIPEVYGNDNLEKEDTAVVMPMKQLFARNDSLQNAETDTLRHHAPIPEGVTPVEDYSEGSVHGMESFYAALDNVNSMDRPVRVGYWGDSYIEGDITVQCEWATGATPISRVISWSATSVNNYNRSSAAAAWDG